MHAAALKREIETVLGLAGAQAASFWRLAAAASAGQSTPTPPPAGPVPVPYPNYAGGVTAGGGGRSSGDYVLTSIGHSARSPSSAGRQGTAGGKSVLDPQVEADLLRCVLAAASGDAASARAGVIWARIKLKIQQLPQAARQQTSQLFSYQLDLIAKNNP
jgi:hypothetical protein